MRNRKWKRKVKELRQELPPSVPIDRGDRLSAIVPIDRICVEGEEQYNEDAAFDKLCASVKRNGVLQPLLVRRICEEDSSFGGVYLLVAGKRRLAAARAAGHRALPCYIVTMDAKEAAVTAFVTDLDCAEKDMFAQSDAIAQMKREFSMTLPEIAARLGRSEIFVAGRLLLQHFGRSERSFILEKGIPEEIALALLQIKDRERRENTLLAVWEKKLQGKAAQDYIRMVVSGSIPPPHRSLADLTLFYNSVDRLMRALRNSGADASVECTELPLETVVTIRVARQNG